MRPTANTPNSLEILEARIAPAAIVALPTIKGAERAYDLDPQHDTHFVSAKTETPLLLKAGQVLTTGIGARSGTYLLFVEQGEALIFTSDFNNNKLVDFNEITGIAAGGGLRLISFVDINGDIVTNLDTDRTLTDSNNSTIGDDPFLKGDGRLLRNVSIEKIELRSLTIADLTDQNQDPDGTVDETDVTLRLALSSYSIHGNILAGAGFGKTGDLKSGLIINDAGKLLQQTEFTFLGTNFYIPSKPTIGAIKTGTAAAGEYFSFSITAGDDIQGTLRTFTPPAGQVGGDIVTVRSVNVATQFNVRGFYAGDGGVGARGGNIENVQLNGDTAGGYDIIAGDGGAGRTGGAGGSVLNFADFGSVTSQVVIQSGDGGTGTAGPGGVGGTIVFNGAISATKDPNVTINTNIPLNLNGGVSIVAGDGGKGFTLGGNGAGLAKGVVTTPEGAIEFPRNVVGSTHDGKHDILTGKLSETGIIGRTGAVDFNNDGFGDIVFTTSASEQLIVQFGDGLGGYLADPVTGKPVRLYLDGPIAAEAITVADFNGDGHQDIAAASSAQGAFGGLFVYLSRYEDANLNGLSKEEDLNRNGVNDFVGFLTPRQSPLPTLNVGDPDGGLAFNLRFNYFNSAHAINDIEAGDFDGDGFTDIAVLATYVEKATVNPIAQILIFMKPDVEDGRPTGEFYANFGSKAVSEPPQGANPFRPFTFLSGTAGGDFGGARGIIEATALSTSASHDVIVSVPIQNNYSIGGITESETSNFLEVWDNSAPSIAGPRRLNSIAIGTVDTNRDVGGDRINLSQQPDTTIRDFTVLDFDNDGRTDFAAITEQPTGYLVAARGNGNGGALVVTKSFSTDDNRGYFFGAKGLNIGTQQRGIRVSDADRDGRFDEIAILDYGAGNAFRIYEMQIETPPRSNPTIGNPGVLFIDNLLSFFRRGQDPEIVAWDLWFPQTNGTYGDYSVGLPSSSVLGGGYIEDAVLGFFTPLAEHYFTFQAGNGGDALIGRGGDGGSLGSILTSGTALVAGTLTNTLSGALDVTLPANINFNGEANFNAGNGGNGFTKGGNGGNIGGVKVRYILGSGAFHSLTNLHGGDGGIGIAAAGGNGGDIRSISVVSGSEVLAGNGGPGLVGGRGGSIVGNGLAGVFDNEDTEQVMTAGNGGNGIKRGGDGGNILNFKGAFDVATLGDAIGLLVFVAGNGGSASSGPGGNGGSVLHASPLRTVGNRLAGDILLQAGNGGDGASGGFGGSVMDFVNNPTISDNPAVLSIIAGSGGRGVNGAGGAGGDISSIKTPTRGVFNPQSLINATVYGFNRILAGNGGASAGAAGGAGGSVNLVESKNDENPFVVVAGAGGSGLTAGGRGGSITNTKIEVGGSTFAKALFVAGDGGDAAGFVPNALDTTPNLGQKAFGGRVGQGGNGGSITGVTQLGGIESRADFIAGNGGSTVNYGTIPDQTTGRYVGRAGSIRDIVADGTLGNINPGIAIRSYNDILHGQTMTDFVTASLRDPLSPGSVDDSFGNVGVVVGAAGRIKAAFTGYSTSHEVVFDSNPAAGAVNGSLVNITAREIMSAVAGSVVRIAAIQSAADLFIIPGGRIGTNKTVGDPVNYRDRNGNALDSPVIDGSLLDGALITSTQPTKGGVPFNYPGNHFVLN